MENYCARLRGETNSKAMEISRMERTALELLRFDRAKKMGIRTSSFPYWKFSSRQGEGREGREIYKLAIFRVPPIVAAPLLSSAREKDETAPFHYPSPCLFTPPSTPPWNREKKWNHSLVVSFGKGEKNKWLTTRENIIEKSPPLDYLFLGL